MVRSFFGSSMQKYEVIDWHSNLKDRIGEKFDFFVRFLISAVFVTDIDNESLNFGTYMS